MTRKTEVPITPSVLEWAMREGGFTPGELADRLRVRADTVDGWLSGTVQPGKTEFSHLVDTLRRPAALFFRPEPPDSTVPADLRSEPSGGRPLGPDELRTIRRAIRLQRVLLEWHQEKGTAPVDFPYASSRMKPSGAGSMLRDALGVPVDEQMSWGSPNEALVAWRQSIADLRIQVLFLQLGEQGIRGFSSWSDQLPMIGVNTAYNLEARIFSIFHELAHLLARTQAACTDVSPKAVRSSRVERWCERVASEALLPAGVVEEVFLGVSTQKPFDQVKAVAAALSVSLRAAALRIGDLGLVEDPNGLYRLIDRYAVTWDRTKTRGRAREPRTRAIARISEVGPPIVSMFSDALASGYLDETDLRDYIGLELREFEEAKSRLAG